MTNDEFANWQARTESSRFKWVEDEIFRLNGRGAFYYTGGEEGIYMKIHKDGRLEAGTYEGAIPHIGEAFFIVKAERQCKDFNEAFVMAMGAGGKLFLADMFSTDTPVNIIKTEKPSVVDKIKESQNTPRAPKDTEPGKNKKNKGEFEL